MAKLTNNLFGRRFWAVVIAILMVVQLLPVAAIADYVELTDESGIVVDTVPNKTYDGGVDVDTVTVKEGHDVAPIGQAQPDKGEGVLPIEPIDPNPGDDLGGDEGTEPEAPGKTDDGEGDGQIGGHIADDFDLNRPDETDTTEPNDGETDDGENGGDVGEQPNDGNTDPEQGDGSGDSQVTYYLHRVIGETAEDYALSANPGADGEYMVTHELTADDKIKVKGSDDRWYPADAGDYIVPEGGTYTIYFRPDGQGGSDWFGGYFYLNKYNKDHLTVTFKKGDVTVATVEVAPGATVGENMPEEPVAPEGKIFADWRVGSEEGALFTADSFVTSDTTVVARFVDKVTVTFNPNTEENGGLANILVDVVKGEAIGDKLPTVPTEQGYTTKWVRQDDETVEVTAETVASDSFTAVVAKKEIIYTVTFVQEDGTHVTRETSVTQGFAVNDLPAVTPKEHQVGKWVYHLEETPVREFTVGTRVFEDTTVYAYYEQNVFTVTFMDGDKVHAEFTTASGTTIVLPTDPVRTGATFSGWFTQPNGQGTQYTASSTVSEDLTLYAYFKDQVRVRFLVKDDQDNTISEKSQYFVDLSVGDTIETLPDDPFLPGKVFDHWKNENNDETVTVGYTVTESFDAVAVFTDIEIYELTMYYYYMNGSNKVEVGTQVYEITKTDVANGFTVTAPSSTIATEIYQEQMYYPNRPTVTVTLEDEWTQGTDDQGNVKMMRTERVEYVAADAEYQVKHWLKDLNGDGFTELIDTVGKTGVKNSVVTPEVNNYAFAKYDHRDENVTITETSNPKQVLNVYYTRRSFTLSYNVSGGKYIDAETAPYGTQITLPTTATRAGYTFAGWYKDADCTQSAGSAITLEADTVLYAKWTPAQSEYKIVYMIENANDDGYSYLATVTKTAATDSTVTMTAQTAGANGTRPSGLDTTNFTFKDSTTETVKADGTTVVTVRYSRNVYTITWEGSGYEVEGNYAYWRTGRGRATLTAKYGADISAQWAATFNTPHPNWCWNFSSNYNDNDEKFTSLDIMPSGNKTVYHWFYSTTKTQVLNYWFENYDGTQTKTYNGRTYGLFKSVTVHYNYLYDTDYPVYAGYTKGGWVRSDGARRLTADTPSGTLTADFYYNALQYPLTFYNYDGTLISTQQVTLNADISSYLTGNVPTAPVEGATWLGWYTDQAHTSSYSGGTKMPTGLVLYAAFQFPTRTVTFDSQGGSAVESQTDEIFFKATKPDDPTRTGYNFLGWFDGTGDTARPYDWNQPVTENITLYAHWQQKIISYVVHYYEWDTANNQATTNKLLEDKHVSDPDFSEHEEITETALTIAGHVPQTATITKQLSFDDNENVFIFYYYTIPNTLTYTVQYVLKDHPEIKVAPDKENVKVPGTTTTVTEMAVDADKTHIATQTSDAEILERHYKPTQVSIEQQLGLENNVIIFEYVSLTTSKITVNYLDMDGNPIHVTDIAYVEKGDTFTVQNKAPDGYIYHHADEIKNGETTTAQATYQITEEGDMMINIYYQRKLIIIANNKSKAYDGTALVSSGLGDITVIGKLRGDNVTGISFTGSQMDAGSSNTTPKDVVITKGDGELSDPALFYSIIYVPGTLTVNPASIYISINADQWETHSGSTGGPNYYTGQTFNVGFTNPNKAHFGRETDTAYFKVSGSSEEARELFLQQYQGAMWNALAGTAGVLISEKDAGTYKVTGAEQKTRLLQAVPGLTSNPNYSVTINPRECTLTIVPLPLTITTPSDVKQYDGTALTKSEGAMLAHSYWTDYIGGTWTAAETAAPGEVTLGTGDKITFNVTGSQTPVGSSENHYEIDWGDTKASNYKITRTLGTLTVTENNAKITLTAPSDEKVYDGTPLTCDGTGEKKVTATGLPEGFTVEARATGTATHVGDEGKNVVNDGFVIKNAQDEDVTALFTNVTKVDGKLTINPKPITITTGSDTKVYNGTELKKNESNIDALAEADQNKGVTVTVTGTQTLVGSSSNTYTIDWGQAKATDYTVTDELGTLTVTAPTDDALVVTKNDGEADGYKYKEGETVTFTITVKNVYAEAKRITLSEIEGVTLTQSTFENVAAGAEVSTTATYTIKPADMAAGSFTNTVTATLEGKEYQATDTVNTKEIDAKIEVTKTA